MLGFEHLHNRLVAEVRGRIRSGELTERGLALRAGLSQPHMHHVLKGKRAFSLRSADAVLLELRLDVIDLLRPEDFADSPARR